MIGGNYLNSRTEVNKMVDVDKLIKDMEAYRQGYEQGRTDGIKNFERIIENICIDIDDIKKHFKITTSRELCKCGEQLLTKEELNKGKCDRCLED